MTVTVKLLRCFVKHKLISIQVFTFNFSKYCPEIPFKPKKKIKISDNAIKVNQSHGHAPLSHQDYAVQH